MRGPSLRVASARSSKGITGNGLAETRGVISGSLVTTAPATCQGAPSLSRPRYWSRSARSPMSWWNCPRVNSNLPDQELVTCWPVVAARPLNLGMAFALDGGHGWQVLLPRMVATVPSLAHLGPDADPGKIRIHGLVYLGCRLCEQIRRDDCGIAGGMGGMGHRERTTEASG